MTGSECSGGKGAVAEHETATRGAFMLGTARGLIASALIVSLFGSIWLWGQYVNASFAAARPGAITYETEGTSMVEWSYQPEDGALMHIVVQQSDYPTLEAWAGAVEFMRARYPNNASPP